MPSPQINIRFDAMLHGPFNHVPAYAKTVTVDFGQRANVLSLGFSAQVCMGVCVLSGMWCITGRMCAERVVTVGQALDMHPAYMVLKSCSPWSLRVCSFMSTNW